MANNLATKYSDRIASQFTRESFIKGKTSNDYDFTGAKTLRIYTPLTVSENDYQRSGQNRYGTPTEMQDTVQEVVLSQDKSFSLTIDKGNNMDQMNTKAAGQMLSLQLKEQSIPTADKYAFQKFVADAGTVMGLSAKPTKDTIVAAIADAARIFDEALVPDGDRYVALTGEMFMLCKLAPEFAGSDSLGSKATAKGLVGEIHGMKVVKVPSSYLPADCYFVAWVPGAVMFPYKISDAKYHKDPPGLSGDLLEGRHYYDAFVLGAKSTGVCAGVLATKKQAAPAITFASGNVTITSTGADTILYTVDGSDPRYSSSAKTYASAVSSTGWEAGEHNIRAVAYASGKFTSDVTAKAITVS